MPSGKLLQVPWDPVSPRNHLFLELACTLISQEKRQLVSLRDSQNLYLRHQTHSISERHLSFLSDGCLLLIDVHGPSSMVLYNFNERGELCNRRIDTEQAREGFTLGNGGVIVGGVFEGEATQEVSLVDPRSLKVTSAGEGLTVPRVRPRVQSNDQMVVVVGGTP